ncbi:hypothetical protein CAUPRSCDRAFT_12085 [Caulochytrium protostelioides]|uniref:VPS9 domain-containing protein n=1 Tax=Caulochytrium protostelioides TaxID=1555241 RepID=A0A4P9WSJ3_9FUNG|nr:hypothetical protein CAUPRSCDRAFT_12085 [Caulochytrium protostelioides]
MGIQRIPELMSVPAYQTLLELTDRYPQLAGHATDLVRFSSLYASGTRVRRDPSPASVNPAILTETAEQLHAFLEAFESHAGDVLPEISDAQLKTLVDGAETLIMHHAFRRLFSACLSVYQLQDIHLSRRLCFMKLGDFSITHLGLTPASHDDMGGVPRTSTAHQSALRAKQLKQQAGLALLAFDSAHTPLQKMDQIIRCHQSLDQYAQHVSWCKTPLSPCLSKESLNPIGIQAAAAAAAAAAGSPATSSDGPPPTTDPVPRTPASPRPFVPSGAPTSADVILPLLIALIVDIGPPRLVSSLHFVETYRRAEAIEGYVAYCFTNLQAAVTFVETMDLSVLTMPADEVAAFERSHGGTRPEQDHATTVEQQRDVIVLPSDPQACEPAAAPHPDRHEPTRVSQAITGIHGMVSGLWPFPSVLPEMPTSMWVRGAESAAPSPTPSASSATQPPRPQQPIALLSSSLERRWSRSPPPAELPPTDATAARRAATSVAQACVVLDRSGSAAA